MRKTTAQAARSTAKRLAGASDAVGRTAPGLRTLGGWQPVAVSPPEPRLVDRATLRTTVLELNREVCFVCTKRLRKGRVANVVDGTRYIHVGRCSGIVRALLERDR